jgi:3-methyladenine DNA glycosylase/8-oxoguanine DNA glycosylase
MDTAVNVAGSIVREPLGGRELAGPGAATRALAAMSAATATMILVRTVAFAAYPGGSSTGRMARRAGTLCRVTTMPPDGERRIPLEVPLDLRRTLGIHLRGRGDPAMRFEVSGTCWRATRTPDGPVTLLVELTRPDGADGATQVLRARAWGPGSTWAMDRLEAFTGLDDDPGVVVPSHPAVAAAVRALPGLRLGRTGNVLESLVPSILEQKITGDEARRVYRALVARHGEPAAGGFGLRLPPAPAVLAALPYHAYHPLGLERRRAELIRAVASAAERLERLGARAAAPGATQEDRDDAYRALRAFPGIGPWTTAEVGIRAFGDPDAVSVGDFHLPSLVTWALAGERSGTDERMLELLELYRGQRGRVVRLLELAGSGPARRGQRLASRSIARI